MAVRGAVARGHLGQGRGLDRGEQVALVEQGELGRVLGEVEVGGAGRALADDLGGELRRLAEAGADGDAGLPGEGRGHHVDHLLMLGGVERERVRGVSAARDAAGEQQGGSEQGGSKLAHHGS